MKTKIESSKRVLVATSLIEGATGLALLAAPALVVDILFGVLLTDSIAIIITRLTGIALITLAIACWFSRNNENVTGFIIALLFYNFAAMILLGYAGLYQNINGPALWPAVAAHILMSFWCVKVVVKIKENVQS